MLIVVVVTIHLLQTTLPLTVIFQPSDSFEKEYFNGALTLTIPTGQSLNFPLKTNMVRPIITASPSIMNFGICHVNRGGEGIMLLSNCAPLEGIWSITHIPGEGRNRVIHIPVQGFDDDSTPDEDEDDPGAFTFSPSSGTIMGPSLSSLSAIWTMPSMRR